MSLTFTINIQPIHISLKKVDTIYYQSPIKYDKTLQAKWKLDQESLQRYKNDDMNYVLYSPIYDGMWSIKLFPKW